jgi:hypothetical protein
MADRVLRCWARRDDAPLWTGGEERGVLRDWLWECCETPVDDLGLCAHHRAVLVGQPGHAATRPAGGGS